MWMRPHWESRMLVDEYAPAAMDATRLIGGVIGAAWAASGVMQSYVPSSARMVPWWPM